jgi:hypothetical protein
MLHVWTDFHARVKEINSYLDFVQTTINFPSNLTYKDSTGSDILLPINTDLQQTLKATAFLLIYNLVESTMSNAIEAIYQHLKTQAMTFDKLNKKVKTIILKNTKKWNPDKLEPNLKDIALDIVCEAFRKEELFSGNVDARRIRETIEEYGVTISHTVNGDNLLTVKARRNDLAHGVTSFADCGSTTTVSELIKYKDDTKDYLTATLKDIETYLVKTHYT